MAKNNDIEEIISFISSYNLESSDNPIEFTVGKLTAEIEEEVLIERAKKIKENFDCNRNFKRALSKLASICDEKETKCNICPVSKYCNTYIANARKAISNDALSMIDLFCGAGGLSLGFTQEGFVTMLANDIEECCIDTYSHNHPETPRDHIILGDIKDVVKNIENLIGEKHPSIVVGGPPCQGFSEANRQRLIDDPRNQLYKNFVEVVKITQPPFFIMENVKGMMQVANQVIEDFKKIGYTTRAHVLNAKDYGVPQSRERLIYIGNRIGVDNEQVFDEIFSLSKDIPNYYLCDALYGLRPLQASRIKNATGEEFEESGYWIESKRNLNSNSYIDLINQGKKYPLCLNHKARYNNDRDIEIYRRMNPGDKSDDPKIADIMPYARRNGIFKDKYFKLEPNKVCKTITAHMKFDCNMYIHPFEARGLTPREAARVQSYPDDYYFRGSYTKTYMQIGNSVPPLLGRAIAKIVKNYIKK